MKRLLLLLSVSLLLLSLLSSCRPPELEGSIVDFNAGRIDNALVLAKEATEKYPGNPEAWFHLGKVYGKKSMFPEMVEAFNKSLEVSPQYASDITDLKMFYFQTKYNDAVNSYNSYTKVEDKSSEAAIKALDRAIKDFEAALTINEKDYNSYRLAAISYSLKGEPESALSYYKKLSEVFPDTASSWLDLGVYYYNQREYEEAIPYLKKAVGLAPEDPEPITYLAQSYDFNQMRDEAIEAYSKAIDLNPEEKALPFNLGLLYIKAAGDSTVDESAQDKFLESSIENFGRVIELDGEIKEAHQLKSTAEIRLERWDDAKETLQYGLEMFPEDPDMWNNLGVCYARTNDKEKAEDAFAKAKELGGE